jgi:hypothetical protein
MKPDGSGVTYEARLSCPVCGLDLRGPLAKTYAEHFYAEHIVCAKGHPLVDYSVPCYRCAPELAGAFERYHDPRGGRPR